MTPRLTVIVPVFNEAARLVHSLERLDASLRKLGGPYVLLVVDDGSRDATPDLLRALARRLPALRSVRLPRNQGKGAAVRAGLRRARGAHALFLDCDLSTPPTEIPRALRRLQAGSDVVIGSRNITGSRLAVPQPPLRRLAGRLFNLATQVLLGLPYADTQCGFKAFTRRAARTLARESRVDGFAFDCELLLLARRHAWRVEELPVTWSDKGPSSIRLLRHTPRMLAALLALQRRFHASIAYHPARSLPLILASVAGAFLGQISFKAGSNGLRGLPLGPAFVTAMASNPWVWSGLFFFGASAITWLLALAKVELSFAFPLLSLNFVITAVFSWLAFGERLAWNRVTGIGLVVAGVLVIAASGRAAERRAGP